MELADSLADRWNLVADSIEVLEGGMNSQTWLVVADGVKMVAKAVDRSDTGFGRGLELAARLDRNGLTTGAPLPSVNGRLAEPWGSQHLAVLKFVDGTPLTGTPEDQAAMGTTLARVHAGSREPPGVLEKWFGLITQFDAHLDLEPWIRPAVEDALNGVRAFATRHELTWAGLHADPAPEAFLRQTSGEIALIDWGGWMLGPELYDLASAVMYAGEEQHVVHAYLAKRPALPAGAVPAFLRFRYAVQAAYFAWRISTDVQTGVTPGNEHRRPGWCRCRR